MEEKAYTIENGIGCCIRVGKSGNSFRGETNELELHNMFEDWLKETGKWDSCRFGYCETWEAAQKDIDDFAVEHGLFEHTVSRKRYTCQQ